MNKKIIVIIFVIISTVILSGCSIKTSATKSDGGIFKTTDFGSNWIQKSFVENTEEGVITIGRTNTNFLVFDPIDEDTIYLSTTGNGVYATTNSGDQWFPTTLSSGTYKSLSIDRRNNDVVYVTEGKNIFKSVDGFKTWNNIYIENRPGQIITSVIVDRFKPNVVYAATTTSILKSFDYGNSWELLDWEGIVIIYMAQSEINPNNLYALTNSGIYKSTNNALEWILMSEGLTEYPGGNVITWFQFDPKTENIILGTNFGIIRSTDGANTWHDIPTLFEFKKIAIKPVIYNPNDLSELIFAVGNVIYKTDDSGATWKTLKTVATTRTINYLIADPYHDDVIFAGTYQAPTK
ncbi:MAG: WD40/YVTN/BNR-like repeat-containing protein [Candidatus Kerfeldbacteria bacterium]|jgi:photosystem II stability/assembly factor-like uncharacterized protein